MKKIKWFGRLMLLFMISSILFTSCGKDDPKEDNDSWYVGSATITLDNGDKVEFKATISAGNNLGEKSAVFGIGTGSAVIVMHIDFTGEPIQPGVHEGSLSLTPINHSTKVVDEKYMNGLEDPETGESGTCTITLTSYKAREYAKGTFSGTLYAESGKKVIITKGKFNVTD